MDLVLELASAQSRKRYKNHSPKEWEQITELPWCSNLIATMDRDALFANMPQQFQVTLAKTVLDAADVFTERKFQAALTDQARESKNILQVIRRDMVWDKQRDLGNTARHVLSYILLDRLLAVFTKQRNQMLVERGSLPDAMEKKLKKTLPSWATLRNWPLHVRNLATEFERAKSSGQLIDRRERGSLMRSLNQREGTISFQKALYNMEVAAQHLRVLNQGSPDLPSNIQEMTQWLKKHDEMPDDLDLQRYEGQKWRSPLHCALAISPLILLMGKKLTSKEASKEDLIKASCSFAVTSKDIWCTLGTDRPEELFQMESALWEEIGKIALGRKVAEEAFDGFLDSCRKISPNLEFPIGISDFFQDTEHVHANIQEQNPRVDLLHYFSQHPPGTSQQQTVHDDAASQQDVIESSNKKRKLELHENDHEPEHDEVPCKKARTSSPEPTEDGTEDLSMDVQGDGHTVDQVMGDGGSRRLDHNDIMGDGEHPPVDQVDSKDNLQETNEAEVKKEEEADWKVKGEAERKVKEKARQKQKEEKKKNRDENARKKKKGTKDLDEDQDSDVGPLSDCVDRKPIIGPLYSFISASGEVVQYCPIRFHQADLDALSSLVAKSRETSLLHTYPDVFGRNAPPEASTQLTVSSTPPHLTVHHSSHADWTNLSRSQQQEVFRVKAVVLHSGPNRRLGGKDAFEELVRELGHPLTKRTVHDLKRRGMSAEAKVVHRIGNLEEVLEEVQRDDPRPLNIFGIPGTQTANCFAGGLSTDDIAYRYISDPNTTKHYLPLKDISWSSVQLKHAFSPGHVNAHGFCTKIDVVIGVKLVFILTPSVQNDYVDLSLPRFFDGLDFGLNNQCDFMPTCICLQAGDSIHYFTNAERKDHRLLLCNIMEFWSTSILDCTERYLRKSQSTDTLPDLPNLLTYTGIMDFLSVYIILVLGPVLWPEAYLDHSKEDMKRYMDAYKISLNHANHIMDWIKKHVALVRFVWEPSDSQITFHTRHSCADVMDSYVFQVGGTLLQQAQENGQTNPHKRLPTEEAVKAALCKRLRAWKRPDIFARIEEARSAENDEQVAEFGTLKLTAGCLGDSYEWTLDRQGLYWSTELSREDPQFTCPEDTVYLAKHLARYAEAPPTTMISSEMPGYVPWDKFDDE
ncbi:hypothetical protein VNI00_018387 [Paramarasmius palmivorus]|uniref:Uncharacterized protein n=1 Tax=Paramarasmius palmivorus TaxID=297713 RepID=A0AAW0AXM0_9AGAR